MQKIIILIFSILQVGCFHNKKSFEYGTNTLSEKLMLVYKNPPLVNDWKSVAVMDGSRYYNSWLDEWVRFSTPTELFPTHPNDQVIHQNKLESVDISACERIASALNAEDAKNEYYNGLVKYKCILVPSIK